MRFLPGRPWIIPIAMIGVFYGVLFKNYLPSYKPNLLKENYPAMSQGSSIVDFSYASKSIPLKVLLIGSIEVAFVAVLETLITAKIADKMTETRFDQSKEVFGMALANILSGLMGGIPCTGVLIRAGVNVASGATDKMSQFISAISTLLIVLLFLPMFSFIPMPIIASILISSALKMVPINLMIKLAREDVSDLLILITTTGVCVLGDGALGLLAGGFLALMRNAANNS